ncbi:MAG TPA: HlyD family efflux transporter periplasmic adaptor subunit, partial [Elusimicrobiota bacterium]|nr:HlyD family efflux transporter periplasmic adaptor subunit [Elusimicrobiota bacterium]
MKRVIALVVAAALAGGGVWYWKAKRRHRRGDRDQTVEAAVGLIEQTVDATGSILPLNRVEVKPPIGGRIEKLLVDEGDKVQVGQILAWMSSTDRAAILDAARAQGPAEFAKWQDDYKPTPIVSPLSGVVILNNTVVGQTVDSTIVVYALADALIAYAHVDESDIGHIHKGQKARIVLDAYPNSPVEGTVFDILYEGTNVSNVITYGVKVRPDHVPDFFRSQMTANISFEVSRKDHALTLPSFVVRTQPDGSRTVTLPPTAESDGKPVVTEVKTGLENDDTVEIVSGLEAGDKVLLPQGKYVPQKAPDSSPLAFSGPKRSGPGQAPKPRK